MDGLLYGQRQNFNILSIVTHYNFQVMTTRPTERNSADIRSSAQKGFTLVELLVVIAIVASLAALVSTSALRMYSKAKETEKIARYKQLYVATESYAADNGWGVCPAKNGEELWTVILSPYLSDRGNKEEIFIDPLWKDYNSNKPWLTGIGMAFQHRLPEDPTRNVIWNADDEDGTALMKQTQITEKDLRILMGDSTNWFLNDKKVDATRHKDGTRGMFLLFDGRVVFYTKEEAILGLTDPEKLRDQP